MSSTDQSVPAVTVRARWLATASAMLGTFSVVLAATILNVALPQLMTVFAVDRQTIQWLVTGFLAAMTTAMLLSAWSVERFGIRATFVAAMLVFSAGSLLGAASPGVAWLIVARILQGAAAGIVQPLGMMVIFRVFHPAERGKGFGIYGLGVILAPSIAPVLGGLLVDLFSWRATFLVALPVCLVAVPWRSSICRAAATGCRHAASTLPGCCCWRERWPSCSGPCRAACRSAGTSRWCAAASPPGAPG
ncbi:MFS transporter [Azospirillum thermophilum]|uniref:Major facilitator superfamily (MFS) profile domain-containing protein n=1 Tax=Azospirillum thermophilum TaxID=2202148 RepID=A0A2S2CLC0_9PROT|nr:MFS transporter [Azospirillum thermophilum]AWK85170.1 hypothetical protein DEW08_02330 [Azospirillum thermophilum]